MANYTNKLGDIFTQEDIEAAALENEVDIDTIISSNELTMDGEKPGKPQGATAKKPVVAPKKQKLVSPSANTSPASNGKKKYPWDPANTDKGRGNQLANFKTGKETKKAKEADVKKSKAVVNSFVDSQTNFENPFDTTTKTDPTDPFNTGAKLDVSNIKYDYLEREDKKAMQFIKSKEDYNAAEQSYIDEVDDNQYIDYIREGAKNYYNDLIVGPISEVANLFGANIDIKMGAYKPLEDETKQAKEELLKSAKKGEKITPEKIQERAKSIYIENKINDQRGKAAEEYFDNLGDKQLQEDLKIRQIAKELNTSDKARQYTMLKKVYNAQIKDFGLYAYGIKEKYNDGTITQEEISEYKVKAKEAKEAYDYLDNINKDFPKVEKQLKTDREKLNFYKLNYDDVETNLKLIYSTTGKAAFGIAKFLDTTVDFALDTVLPDTFNRGDSFVTKEIDETLDYLDEIGKNDKTISFDSVDNFSDFGKYMGNLFSQQVPQLAGMYFGGATAAGAFSVGTGGQKIYEMEQEAGADYSSGTKLLAGIGFAAAEFIPEKLGTLRMFENLKGTMSSVSKESRELFKEGMLNSVTKAGSKVGMESVIGAGTEGLTEFLGMTIDEQLLGKKYTAQTKVKRIKEAGFGGLFMDGPMQVLGGANVLIAKELRNYATENELAESKKIVDRIDFLQNELVTNVRLTKTESNQIKEEINKLADASVSIIENSGDRVYNMTEEDMVSVVKINQKQADLKNSYIELSNSNFSNEIKAEKAKELNNEFKELERNREFLLTDKYARINRVINDAVAIDDSIGNITKVANSIGRVEFDNKIGDQKGIAVFNSQKELGDAYKIWLIKDNKNEDGTEKLTPAQIDSEVEQGMKSDGFKLPNGQIVINKAVAANVGAINVVNHEFLHKILDSTFKDKKQGALLVNQFLNVLSTKERAAIQKRIDSNYRYFKDSNGNIVEKNFEDYAEEYLNVFIDEISYKNIKDTDNVKQLLLKIADPILKYFRRLGFNKIEFESGNDVYQFLKSYQKNISKGKISERARKLINQEQVDGRVMFSKSIEERMDKLDDQLASNEIGFEQYETEMKKLEQEEFEESKKTYEEEKKTVKKETAKKDVAKKEPSEVSEAAAKAKAKLDAIGNDPKGFNPNNPAIYDELDKMVKVKSRNYKTSNGTIIDLTNKNKGGLDGFSMEEMTSYITVSMLPYIQKFDPSKNDSLYGYINAQLANRMKGALKSGQVADVVFTEDVTEMTKLSNEEVEVKSISLPERKRFQNILESGVFSPDVIESVQTKIAPLIRTLESKFNEKITLNQTVSPLIREIKNYIGAQADIDIKKAMGGKEDQVLQNWLITNKKTVLENLPTTWLMGKDNGKTVSGGMPFAIQKQVNGKWTNYPEWIGKKVDREAVTTDLAGRTSGHELVRRLPEVNKNVSVEEFLSSIIDLKNGNVLRGRKESLAKIMSEELTLDILIDDFLNDGPLFQLFVKNQEAKGILRDDIIVNDIVRQSERGNVKFSLTQKDFDSIRLNSLEIAERIQSIDNITSANLAQALYEIGWEENRIEIVAKALAGPLSRNRRFFGEDDFIDNTKTYLQGFENEKDYGERMYQLFNTKRRVATIFKGKTGKRTVEMLRKKNMWFGKAVIKKYGQEKGLQLLKSFWSQTIVNSTKDDVKIYNNVKEFNDFLEDIQISLQDRKNLSKKATINNVIGASEIKAEFRRPNKVFGNMFNGDFDPQKDFKKTEAAKDFLIFASKWWVDSMKNKESVYSAAMFTMLFKDIDSLGKAAAPVVGIIKDGEFGKAPYVFEHTVPGRHIAYLLAKKIYLKDDSMSYEDIFNDYNVLIVPEKISIALDASGVKDMVAPFHYFPFIKKNTFARYDAKLVKELINNNIQLYRINEFNTKNEKALTNNLSQSKKSMSISTVSDFINTNNLKRIDAETSFNVLNDLNKKIENYWGVVPNDIIVKMSRAVDYAFDVIEDRENEGGPLMAAVNDALNLETIKFAEKQLNEFIENNRPKETKYSKTLDFEFNDILERNTGVEAFTKVSDVVAKRTGIKKNTLSFFVPPSADDFRGLTTYMFAGKGKQGEQDQEFFDRNLTVPYVKGINTLDSVRQSIRKEYKMLLNNFPEIKKKLEKLTPDKGFTYDQAVRVYLWSSTGKDVPGLSRTDKNKLLYFVKQNPDLLAFANALSITGRQDGGWIDPSTTWDSETIISDLHNITEGAGRKKYLEEFIENADAIFTKENLNKIQSIYGTNVREALEDSLYRMKNGKNRPEGTDRVTNTWMNWINGSTAAIMFFNTRSALLQTISAMNFLNWNDNNPYMAGKAFLNQKQYWSDFAMIINSDKLKERRSGLKADVTQAEIANAANSAKNKFNGVISYLQKIGFTPTQAADSFSIAVSGATFYRNRVNTYLKAGDTVEVAEEKAFNDFSIITDQSMQSADPMYVSKQQTTALGRIILAFGNTPMQYNRLIKKATLDLVNKRGDWRTNVSKIVYYGALQNILFSALQSALFIPLGYDDDEEPDTSKMTKEEKKAYEKLQKKQEDKITNMINGMADTLLRGSGVYGAAIATVKNTIMEYFKQEAKEMFADHAYTVLALTSVSPPISSKARKLYGSIRISKFEKDVIAERGWEVTRDGKLNLAPNYRILGNVTVATTNLPLDRVVEKVNNMAEVMDSRNTKLQRGALALGWKDWELNVKNEENETIKATAKEKRKEEGIVKAIETRAENKKLEKEKYRAMSVGEKAAYRKEIKEEKRKQKFLKRKRKRKMG